MSQENPFAAPTTAEVGRVGASTSAVWFSVGTTKVAVLTVLSLGLYAVYWFERHYRFQQRVSAEDTWPLARGLFSVFFALELFRRVELLPARRGWTANAMGGLYIACVVGSRIVDRATNTLEAGAASGIATLVSTLLLCGSAYALATVQGTINAELDRVAPDRARNTHFTPLNWLLMVAGGALLVLGVLGSFAAGE